MRDDWGFPARPVTDCADVPWGQLRPRGLARLLIAAAVRFRLTGASRHGRMVYRLLCRLGGPWFDLEDVGVRLRLHVEDIERLIRRRGR